MSPWHALRASIAFLTRIPVGQHAIDAEAISWAPAFFPLVGCGLGAISYATFRLTQPFGWFVAATLTTALSVLLTGAFHEDGLADSADALLGAVSGERAIEIMRDSRIGTYGATALVLVLMLRIGLLGRVGPDGWVALLLSAGLARLGPVWLMTHVEHAAPNQSKHKDLTAIRRSRAYWATGLMLVLSASLGFVAPDRALLVGAAWFGALLVTGYVGQLGRRRLGGITGDLLGACEQLGEVVILGVFAVCA